jgi:hypothetical protein
VTFGPSELAQLMRGMQAIIAIAMLLSVGAGIVLGSIIAYRKIISAKQQRPRPNAPIFLATLADAGLQDDPRWRPWIESHAYKLKIARHLNRGRLVFYWR